MLSIQAKREKIKALSNSAKKLMDDRKDLPWRPEDDAAYNTALNEIDALKAEIVRMERLLQVDADESATGAVLESATRNSRGASASKISEIHNRYLRGGATALNAEDWQTIRATLSTTTPAEGGYAVPTEVATSIIDKLKDFGGLRSVANVIRTDMGHDISFPTSDGTAEEGEIVAENAPSTPADPSFGTLLLKVFKFSSKVVTAPFELLQDAAVDIEAFINGRLAKRIAAATNKVFTIGTGTGQPTGIFVAATVGKVGPAGQTTTVTFEDLIDLVHSVDPAYRASGQCGFMMHDTTFKGLRKLKDTAGRPIFIPGFDGLGKSMPDTILGYPVTLNAHAPVPAANAKTIAFGDFKAFTIRDVSSSLMLRRYDDSQYAEKGQVGFQQWSRHGGVLLDTGAVKVYQHPAT